jgi:hypothetical protein
MVSHPKLIGSASLLALLCCGAPPAVAATGHGPGLGLDQLVPTAPCFTDDPDPERDWSSQTAKSPNWATPAEGRPTAHDSGALAPPRPVAARLPAPVTRATSARAPPAQALP